MGKKYLLMGLFIIFCFPIWSFGLTHEVESEKSIESDPPDTIILCEKDLNNDGKEDMIQLKNKKIFISFQTGDGFIQPKKSYGENVTSFHIAISDFNNDKELDLALGEKNGITIYLNNGKADFMKKLDLVTDSPVLFIQSGDIDGDGDCDLVFIAGGIFVVQNGYNRTGNIFVTQILEPSQYNNSLWLDDVNGDCVLDIISPPKCYINDGSGFFSETPYGVHCANPVHCSEATVNMPD